MVGCKTVVSADPAPRPDTQSSAIEKGESQDGDVDEPHVIT